jgi:hypothetical protein
MIRINISKNNIRHTVSMQSIDQFVSHLRDNYSFHGVLLLAKTVWDLKVAEPYTQDGYTFSIQSKRRSGNILMNGK